MKPEDATSQSEKGLLDNITADPEFINRGLAEAIEPVQVAPVSVVVTPDGLLPVQPIVLDRDNLHRVPLISLLEPRVVRATSGRKKLVVGVVLLMGVGGVGGLWGWYMMRDQPAVVVPPASSPAVSSQPTPSISPLPSPTPVPAPVPAPAPVSVTAPMAAPTVEHPQAVTITSKSGLWLRSSPSSASRNNIIGWMPNGATIQVDAVGDFWWHGTYRGEPGYFAVSYTQ